MDPELQYPWGLHVPPSGQVLVCGSSSHAVIQVDGEGRKRLATLLSEQLVSQKDRQTNPVSVCYNTNMHQIIVGLNNGKNIVVSELQ
ncbi:hypothetical protein DPMN_150504 [Dreissena polymorpha]|uniref:Uncharacterized protein n=1 Tax=Dreissena polymorpha TaxID=45954 RepID=A0A9D4J6E0_DREPO|nr:hypothetical protein DPMN_150504 [Dreissena polymorpha]